jgi:hypothetical protein
MKLGVFSDFIISYYFKFLWKTCRKLHQLFTHFCWGIKVGYQSLLLVNYHCVRWGCVRGDTSRALHELSGHVFGGEIMRVDSPSWEGDDSAERSIGGIYPYSGPRMGCCPPFKNPIISAYVGEVWVIPTFWVFRGCPRRKKWTVLYKIRSVISHVVTIESSTQGMYINFQAGSKLNECEAKASIVFWKCSARQEQLLLPHR